MPPTTTLYLGGRAEYLIQNFDSQNFYVPESVSFLKASSPNGIVALTVHFQESEVFLDGQTLTGIFSSGSGFNKGFELLTEESLYTFPKYTYVKKSHVKKCSVDSFEQVSVRGSVENISYYPVYDLIVRDKTLELTLSARIHNSASPFSVDSLIFSPSEPVSEMKTATAVCRSLIPRGEALNLSEPKVKVFKENLTTFEFSKEGKIHISREMMIPLWRRTFDRATSGCFFLDKEKVRFGYRFDLSKHFAPQGNVDVIYEESNAKSRGFFDGSKITTRPASEITYKPPTIFERASIFSTASSEITLIRDGEEYQIKPGHNPL